MPNSSKKTTSSLRLWSLSFDSFACKDFLDFSICLMVNLLPPFRFASAIPSMISSICSSSIRCCLSILSGIFSNWLWPMITASMSLVAILAQNFFRFLVSKSFFVATSRLAAGYSWSHSAANCSMMWFGTTIMDLLQSPSRLHSIAAATIV